MENSTEGANALKNIDGIKMFSQDGWSRVHRECGNIKPGASEEDLANGNITFMNIWFDDNGVEESDFADPDAVYENLLERFVDYLQHD